MNTMNQMQEEATQNIELHHFILETFGLQSKKKRVRKKLFKQVVSQEKLLKKLVSEFKQADQDQEQESAEETTYIKLDHLPVTTLLKIGKEFFKEEESVRFYYNKNKESYYKNKDVLVQCISSSFEAANHETQKAIIQIVSK
ncbi:hypothetical protein [Bacillus sp. B1-b2]|uniref:hypothetical protein n=1 Tax=Bacillus sp. B1-b2 TaxID=2653201 RepID=UPI0012614112|nr:hypothetical protein [Bacillus sp. B1-b2]KAB7667613.1 hypothetical protein F9279_15255 [Bacillus sp. B1-b2]